MKNELQMSQDNPSSPPSSPPSSQQEPTLNDALGDPIVLGNSYGYTTSKGGVQNVCLGIAKKITKTGVTMDLYSRTKFYYGQKSIYPTESNRPTNVSSHLLFPVVIKTSKQETLQ